MFDSHVTYLNIIIAQHRARITLKKNAFFMLKTPTRKTCATFELLFDCIV